MEYFLVALFGCKTSGKGVVVLGWWQINCFYCSYYFNMFFIISFVAVVVVQVRQSWQCFSRLLRPSSFSSLICCVFQLGETTKESFRRASGGGEGGLFKLNFPDIHTYFVNSSKITCSWIKPQKCHGKTSGGFAFRRRRILHFFKLISSPNIITSSFNHSFALTLAPIIHSNENCDPTLGSLALLKKTMMWMWKFLFSSSSNFFWEKKETSNKW